MVCHLASDIILLAGAHTNAQAEEDRVNARVDVLMRLALQENIEFRSNEQRCRAIVLFQDRATQGRDLITFCRSALVMVYNAMFPRNPQPEMMEELMNKFRSPEDIYDFVKAQIGGWREASFDFHAHLQL
jgi:hypothetical protein